MAQLISNGIAMVRFPAAPCASFRMAVINPDTEGTSALETGSHNPRWLIGGLRFVPIESASRGRDAF